MLEATRQFADPQVAHDFFVAIRWPNGVACPLDCGSVRVAYMPKRRRWYCNDCKGQFTAKVGTVFEDSPIGFDKWLPAIWLVASNRNGISSCELARALKVTQKTAWYMLHRIRLAMRDKTWEKLGGDVEIDETFVGGKLRNRKRTHQRKVSGLRGGGNYGKTPVMGMLERKGRVRAFVVPSIRKVTLQPKILEHIHPSARLFTDSLYSYEGLDKHFVSHETVNHLIEYVRGHVHTNSIEGFWSVLKRMIKGTYIAPRPKHLQAYVEEEVFRFNAREMKDGERFPLALAGAEGARLTYKALIAER
ncbi:MAG TPA: IS1595 family transposase [Candidatus Baltobacteraceae bacterium]|jgi:transposase-like protein|nr:IS1595 family transposase [Candidatus Baltobacteraceae bacterium]